MRCRCAIALAVALAVSACGGAGPRSGSSSSLAGSITVFAAASLTDAFKDVAGEFGKATPGTDVVFSFASSSTLATQIANGAPADVFASADEATMQRLVDAKLIDGAPSLFAGNRLEIAVAPGNPKRIVGLADLVRPGLIVVLAGPTVPAGRYAQETLAKAGVSLAPASLEVDVRSVLNKVATGEADAGIVYATDVLSAAMRVGGVSIPEAQQVVARYPAAAVTGARNAPVARAFVAYLVSDDGQRVLGGFGFSKP